MIPEEVRRLLGGKQEDIAVLYARVSSRDQDKDLETQLKTLEQYATAKGYKIAEAITDIASGLNENRKGLKKLIELAKEGNLMFSSSHISIDLRVSASGTLRSSSMLME
ncbi:MAG: hypothetical protein DRN26_04350 [Thermoplasmata archaeon]|nr:MAG: hypothetical protein DRN26_04350 [Thermoplasmata archaeon]